MKFLKNKSLNRVFASFIAGAIFLTNPIVSQSLQEAVTSGNLFRIFSVKSTENFKDTDPVKFGSSKFKQAFLAATGNTDKDFRASVEDVTYADVKGIETLDLKGYELDSIDGIKYFTGLKSLDISENLLTSLNLSNNVNLTTLKAYNNRLASIDLSSHTELIELNVAYNDLKTLDLKASTKLQKLYANKNELVSLSIPNSLVILDINENNIETLDTSTLSLTHINANDNRLKAIDLSNSHNIQEINLNRNGMKTLTMPNTSANLVSLQAVRNNIEVVNLNGAVKLEEIDLSENEIHDINVSDSTALTKLNLSKNRLSSLDLTNNTKLILADVSYNQLTNLVGFVNTIATRNSVHNFLPDNLLISPDGLKSENIIQLIGSEKKVDVGNTLTVDHNDFYVVYGKTESRYFAKLSPSHTLNLVSIPVQDNNAFNNNNQAIGEGAIKRTYSISGANTSDNTKHTANFYAYVRAKDYVDYLDSDPVPFVDDNFKQAIIKRHSLSGKNGSASVRDITYGDVKNIHTLNFDEATVTDEVKGLMEKAESMIGVSYFQGVTTNVGLPAVKFKDVGGSRFALDSNKLLGLDLSYNNNIGTHQNLNEGGQIYLPDAQLSTLILPVNASVGRIYTKNNNLSNIKNLETITKLKALDIHANKTESLDISKANAITFINLAGKNSYNTISYYKQEKHLRSLKLPVNLPGLTHIYLNDNRLSGELDLSTATNLTYLTIAENKIEKLKLSDHQNLTDIIALSNMISEITFSNLPKLKLISLNNNHIKSINASNLPSLETFQANYNKFESLNFGSSTKLHTLHVRDARLKGTLDLTNNVKITGQFTAANNRLENIIFNDGMNASQVYVYSNRLTSLDTKNSTSSELRIYDNQIHSITTKNPNTTYYARNFLDSSDAKNQLRFLSSNRTADKKGKAFTLSLKPGEAIDLKDAVGYNQFKSINGEVVTLKIPISTVNTQRFSLLIESGADLFTVSGSTLTVKAGASGIAKVRVVLDNITDDATKRQYGTTENYIEINVGDASINLADGNSGVVGEKDAYLYRYKQYRDPGFSINGSFAIPLTSVERTVTKISGAGAGKSFTLPVTNDIKSETIDFTSLAVAVGIPREEVFGEFTITYKLTTNGSTKTRKLFIIDQLGDVNRDGSITASRDASTGKLDPKSDAGILYDFLANVEGVKFDPNTSMDVADVNGDNLITPDDANRIKNYVENPNEAYYVIKQKYTFLVP